MTFIVDNKDGEIAFVTLANNGLGVELQINGLPILRLNNDGRLCRYWISKELGRKMGIVVNDAHRIALDDEDIAQE